MLLIVCIFCVQFEGLITVITGKELISGESGGEAYKGRLEKPETGIRNRNGNGNRNRNRNRKQQRNRNSNVKGNRYKNRDIIYFKLF